MSDAFAERRIDAGGAPVRCLERGQGETVVSLHAGSGAANAFEQKLAEKFRVIALESPDFAADGKTAAERLAKALGALGLGKYALMASGETVAAALLHAAEAAPEALVLLSPTGPLGTAEAHLGDIAAPTLILVGTKDGPATVAAGRACERIPESYPMLVYDSGPAMAAERPDALNEAVADFLERRGRFILERQETVISR
jgi:pimeloyl-ACP methyl ester carboxylesterase